jgi:hypothetical protein
MLIAGVALSHLMTLRQRFGTVIVPGAGFAEDDVANEA